MSPVGRLLRVDLISADPERLAAFYGSLGFTCLQATRHGAVGEGRLALRLAGERIDLVKPSHAGAPYPACVPGWSPRFQHFAIVVRDIRAAYARLRAQGGWTAISTDGPQRLPQASGGATAFKFRDPEGHPLELIAFAPAQTPDHWRLGGGDDLFLGIDHSAISVTDSLRSAEFYAGLGLVHTGDSFNVGIEQTRLDGLAHAHVEVTALSAADHPTPHVELLCYRGDFIRDIPPPAPEDIAASRLVFEIAPDQPCRAETQIRRDPDGHIFVMEEAGFYSGST